jgi:GTPase
VKAFSATLEEAREADLILHVADASEPEERRAARAAAVDAVLEEIGAEDVPRLRVLNKVDLLDAAARDALGWRDPDAVRVSAVTGEGLDDLRRRLAEAARARLESLEVMIPYDRAGLIASVYAEGSQVVQEATAEGTRVSALMPAAAAGRLRAALRDGLSG